MFRSEYDGFVYEHDDPIFHHHIQMGQSEPYPRDFAIVKKYLNLFPHKSRDYLDVGGHIGTTVMPFLKHYKRCVAYEPNPTNYERLVRNVELNGLQSRCISKNVGCSDQARVGQTILHEGGNSGCYYFKESVLDSKESGDRVKTIRLDDDEDIRISDIDFIKIDTEGHELFVLKGAEQTLLRCKPLIQLETNGLSDKYFGISKQQIFDYLYSLGACEWDVSDGANSYFYFPNLSLVVEPKTIFCLWMGSNPMSESRQQALKTFPENQLKLITKDNLHEYILSSEPLHPAFQYLSETHKADYMRTYLMNFYGGGYADIKFQTGSWDNAFESMKTGNYDACGYYELLPAHIAHPDFASFYKDIIGNCAYIFKPYTSITREWYRQMISYLDSVYLSLMKHPAQRPDDCLEMGKGYPIGWNHMLGRIFHPLVYKYRSMITDGIPSPSFLNYR
jgi:FkbM family methyltransferase